MTTRAEAMKTIFIASLAVTLTPFVAAAQPGRWAGGGGWGGADCWSRIYDPSKTITLDGTVTSIEEIAPPRGMSQGIHAVLATKDAELTVLLAPSWYLDRQDNKLTVGDTVQVVGSRQTLDGKEVIVAKTVMKGDKVLRLRDDNGIPLWAGCRRQ
jgi:hypothetical protein